MKISKSLLSIALASCLVSFGAAAAARAGEIFSTDFSKGTFASLGWEPKGDWSIFTFGADKPDLAKQPGPVAKFAANGQTVGTLTKKFDAIKDPTSLKLTFDAGYGWGSPSHVTALQVMILDADGNGYVFDCHRAKATWGAQYGNVTKYGYNDPLNWAPAEVDTTKQSIMDGGGLRTFTITRDASGKWTFNGDGWTGGPVTFTDTTTKSFSQVVLRGMPNTDDLAYGKIKLEAEAAK